MAALTVVEDVDRVPMTYEAFYRCHQSIMRNGMVTRCGAGIAIQATSIAECRLEAMVQEIQRHHLESHGTRVSEEDARAGIHVAQISRDVD